MLPRGSGGHRRRQAPNMVRVFHARRPAPAVAPCFAAATRWRVGVRERITVAGIPKRGIQQVEMGEAAAYKAALLLRALGMGGLVGAV